MPETMIERDIIRIVASLQRSYQRVYPWMVAAQLDYYRCEQTLRRDMMALVERGKLIRVGGRQARRGYRAITYGLVQVNGKWRLSMTAYAAAAA